MTHKRIHRFQWDFTVKDAEAYIDGQSDWKHYLISHMRDKGYVPVLDMDPVTNVSYNEDAGNFQFTLTIHGVYVGKKRAWEYEGMSRDSLVPRKRTVTSSAGQS